MFSPNLNKNTECPLGAIAQVRISNEILLQTGFGRDLPFAGTVVTFHAYYAMKMLGKSLERLPKEELIGRDCRLIAGSETLGNGPQGKVIKVEERPGEKESDRVRVLKGLRAAAAIGANDVAITFSDFDPKFGFEELGVDTTTSQDLVQAEYLSRLLETAKGFVLGVHDFAQEHAQSTIGRILIVAQNFSGAELLRQAAFAIFQENERPHFEGLASLCLPKDKRD